MEIIKNDKGELEGTLIVKIEEKDYINQYEAELKKLGKSANIKGFRPGKVPTGVLKKMFGNEVKVQEVHKILDESVKKYLKDNSIDIIGDLLQSEEHETKFDVANSNDYEFAFDFGYFPEIKINLQDITVPEYNIELEETSVDEEIENLLEKNKEPVEVEQASIESVLRVDLTELNEDKTPKENGIKTESSIISVEYVSDEAREQFVGVKKDSVFTIDVKQAFQNESDLAGLLNIGKDKIQEIGNLFEVKIVLIEDYKKPKLNEKLFERFFGQDNVKTEEEFKEKIREKIIKRYNEETKIRLKFDLMTVLQESFDLKLPDEFIVRLYKNNSKEKTEEEIRKDLDSVKKALKWDRIITLLSNEFNLKVEQEDLLNTSKQNIMNYMAQMGIAANMFPKEQLNKFAADEIKKMDVNNRYQLVFKILEDKVLYHISDKVKKEQKNIKIKELVKIYEEENKKLKKENNLSTEQNNENQEEKTKDE